MVRERELQVSSSPDIEIIGEGNVGEKVRQLILKTPDLRKIGFRVPRRVILAENFFDGFFQENGIAQSLRDVNLGEKVESRITGGSLSVEDLSILQRIVGSFGNTPLVIRSSGEGDSRGTGIYKTEFSENNTVKVSEALKKVLASYFSKDAIVFRKDAQTGEGFGIIIEPLIGQEFTDRCEETIYAPVISGFGYTSTSRGEGYINAVPGIGGGVETRDGEIITKRIIQEYNGLLKAYLNSEQGEIFGSIGKGTKRSRLLQTSRDGELEFNLENFRGLLYKYATQYEQSKVCDDLLPLNGKDMKAFFQKINLLPLFEMMIQMENRFVKPQYFEWAMTGKRNPIFWIIQIADAEKKLDFMDFDNLGTPILEGYTVTGTGIKRCTRLVYCPEFSYLTDLDAFNLLNRDYLLIYSSRCTEASRIHNRGLSYSNFNNASALLEYQELSHADSPANPLDHLLGQVDMSGKLFGVLEQRNYENPPWEKLKRIEEETEIPVYEADLKVVASERQNRIFVYKNE